jgi:HAE1 family hydrophobic/amphiphilic exporter-1
MAEDLDDPIWASDLAPIDAPDATVEFVDVPQAIAQARRHRSEIAELNAQVAQEDLELELVRYGFKPRLDLVAGYTMRGMAGDLERTSPIGGLPTSIPASLTGGVGNSWRNLLDSKFPDAVVGVSFEMPLGRREARGRISAAEAERRRAGTSLAAMHERIATEVLNAATSLETAAGRIRAARAGLEAAETQLRAEQDRFAVGLSTNFFVLTRQNDLALAQLAEIAALTDYRKAQTELSRATGTLLRDRNIAIE